MEQLQEMGFAEEVVRKALLLCHNRLEQAMEWLLEHAGDPDAATPLTDAQLRGLSAGRRRRRPARRQRVNASLIQQVLAGRAQAGGSPRPPEPPEELVAQLEEMGFGPEQARVALRSFGNNVEMACNWLLASEGATNEASSSAAPAAHSRYARQPAGQSMTQAGM
eukprot:scaffold164846_cov26-Prasinocladus_malaysianus.AAC.1